MRLTVCSILVGLLFLGVVAAIGTIGKPRGPLTPGTAAAVVVWKLACALMTIYLYLSGE